MAMQDLPLFYAPDVEKHGTLPSDEAGHAQRVLRLSAGDKVQVCDGKGGAWLAEILAMTKQACSLSLLEPIEWQAYWQGKITLCVAPTKSMDRMEWLLEKAVELGLDRIVLLKTKHSERKHINAERLQKILISAMKQSQKCVLPELLVGLDFAEALALTEGTKRLIFHCRESIEGIKPRELPHSVYNIGEDVSLFIGPEGDFTREEVIHAQNEGAQAAQLGESRLRTETAGLSALQWIHTLQMIKN